MRTLFLMGLVLGGAFMAGWFTIERDGDRTRIEINKSEIRNDARHAIDKGRDILDKREQERLAREQQQQDGYAQGQHPPNQDNWPPPSAPMPGSGGYPDQNQYGNPPGYGDQPYGGQSAPGNYQPQPPRWSETPPPWQQQNR